MNQQKEQLWQEAIFVSGQLLGKRIWVKPERPHLEMTSSLYPYRDKKPHAIMAYQTYIMRWSSHVYLYVSSEEIELLGNMGYGYPVRLREWVAQPGFLRHAHRNSEYYQICQKAGL